jgi:hypothetical protein
MRSFKDSGAILQQFLIEIAAIPQRFLMRFRSDYSSIVP